MPTPDELLAQEKRTTRLKEIQSEMKGLSKRAVDEKREFTNDEKEKFDGLRAEFERSIAEESRNKELEKLDRYIKENHETRDALQTGQREERGAIRQLC